MQVGIEVGPQRLERRDAAFAQHVAKLTMNQFEAGAVALHLWRRLGSEGGALVEAAKQAFVDGIGVAALAGAAVVAIAAVISFRLLPHGPATATAEVPVLTEGPREPELAFTD